MPNPGPPTIATRELSYAFPDGSKGLQHINLDLPANARCLLIGGKQCWPQLVLLMLNPQSEWRWQDHAPPSPLREAYGTIRHRERSLSGPF